MPATCWLGELVFWPWDFEHQNISARTSGRLCRALKRQFMNLRESFLSDEFSACCSCPRFCYSCFLFARPSQHNRYIHVQRAVSRKTSLFTACHLCNGCSRSGLVAIGSQVIRICFDMTPAPTANPAALTASGGTKSEQTAASGANYYASKTYNYGTS